LISFSTQPGNVALDGTGRNSPFAAALFKHLIAPKDDLSAILIDVRNDVMKATQDRQVPWEHSTLRGRFYFGLSSGAPPTPQLVDPAVARAARDYDLAAKVGTKEAWDAFLTAHPTGFHAELARVQRSKLTAKTPAIGPELDKDTRLKPPKETEPVQKTRMTAAHRRGLACCIRYMAAMCRGGVSQSCDGERYCNRWIRMQRLDVANPVDDGRLIPVSMASEYCVGPGLN
jgi:hypothetical protein